MSGILIVVNKVTSKGTVGSVFLGTMFILGIIQTEHPSFLEHAEVVTKADTGFMNVVQQVKEMVTPCHLEYFSGNMSNLVQSFPVNNGGNLCSEQLKNPMPIVKNHTALSNRRDLENKAKISGEIEMKTL